ncbi:outer membrane protein transport protein (OMPP1/FadL/TodX) [Nitrosomonas nitrosa]|nr:outer membrane protein transport protein (OMPP1/FadL/TodX) [Nitrosomonas nitrosa]
MEQSVKELGQAFSGAPVNIDDGSMVFFNPGAMNQVRGKLISVAGYVIAPSVAFQDSSSHLSPSLGGMPILGNNGGDLTDPVFIPNFYYVHELTERLAFGFGANVPFGMRNSYHPDWKGRYQAIDSEIMTLNINPSLSLQLTEKTFIWRGLQCSVPACQINQCDRLWGDLFPSCGNHAVRQSGTVSTNCRRLYVAQR